MAVSFPETAIFMVTGFLFDHFKAIIGILTALRG